MQAPAPLEALAVVKEFVQGRRSVRALDGVDLTAERGELVAVMGASGSGKSTLLHAIAGLTSIDAGSIRIDGEDLAGASDVELTRLRRERIGLVFQAFNLIPMLTVEANVRLPAKRTPELGQRARSILARLGLEDRIGHRPDALSGGEQQRVAIARALVTDPAMLLLDEPTGSLDSEAGLGICRLMRALCDEEQRCVVVVTHEASVAAWADRVVVLKDGRVVGTFDGDERRDPQALAERYQRIVRDTEPVTS
ncbi:MAG: ABC transporter ATP-binding protein [Planctomycetota bacterium]